MVQKVIMGYALVVEQKGLTLKTDFPSRLPEVQGDKEHLTRVISNLIDNAVKYTPKGEILVYGEERDGRVEIHVRDTGMGIGLPREQYDKLFQRFYQERPRYDGVGVGLAICRAIVEAHGGKIWAESEGTGKGSTFSFFVPLTGQKDESHQ
ncbi:MAG TPA: sensor histidine kinase [Candidatus Tripitaka sp. YC43]